MVCVQRLLSAPLTDWSRSFTQLNFCDGVSALHTHSRLCVVMRNAFFTSAKKRRQTKFYNMWKFSVIKLFINRFLSGLLNWLSIGLCIERSEVRILVKTLWRFSWGDSMNFHSVVLIGEYFYIYCTYFFIISWQIQASRVRTQNWQKFADKRRVIHNIIKFWRRERARSCKYMYEVYLHIQKSSLQ
jgi:hypothetical protein